MSLQDKRIVITGGAGGLGQGVAQVARAQGARVIVLDIVTVGDELADESYVVDLINSDSVNDCFAQIGDLMWLPTLRADLPWALRLLLPMMIFGRRCLIST